MRTTQNGKVVAGLFRRESAWPHNGAAGPFRIWLVDDDEVFLDLLAGQLAKSDQLQCGRQFESGELLLFALSREAPPHAILLDVHLRDRNGIDFIQPIKALAPATRVLMLTPAFEPRQAARAFKEGASAVLEKGSSLDEIGEQIIDSIRVESPHPRLYLRANSRHAPNALSISRTNRIRAAGTRR